MQTCAFRSSRQAKHSAFSSYTIRLQLRRVKRPIPMADIKTKLATAGGRADRLSKADKPDAEKISELYLAAFSREPRPDELQIALDYLAEERTDAAGKPVDKAKAARENFEDLVWALTNTKEFLFNH